MKGFLTVLKFEIGHYLKNKAFVITTLILIAASIIGFSIPTIIDVVKGEDQSTTEVVSEEKIIFGLFNSSAQDLDINFLATFFENQELKLYSDAKAMKDDINSNKIKAGFQVDSPLSYTYVVINNEMSDQNRTVFEMALTEHYRKNEAESLGLSYDNLKPLFEPEIMYNIDVLGKDSMGNYLYTYLLVFALYFMIIMYGQLIATSVASEKSNRTMELLVTSTKSTYLIFGKVLGGAFAGILQFGLVIAAAKFSYVLNGDAWGGKLDFVMNIPSDIILKFSIFAILGYLFYAFIFGALGALVSRTEDVGASATPVTMTFVAVFAISMIGMQNTEGILLKVASFVPFSSFMAMFVRISMGSVSTLEVVLSLGLLAASTFFIGWLGAKIYRMGTLMYGNPVKLKDVFKILKSQ